MNIIKVDDDSKLYRAEEKKLGNQAPEILPDIEVKYTIDEISQLADAFNIHWPKTLIKYLRDGASGAEHIQSINKKVILEDIINQAIDRCNYAHSSSMAEEAVGTVGRTAILLMTEDVPLEDVPVYWPGEDDPILLTIFKWRLKIGK